MCSLGGIKKRKKTITALRCVCQTERFGHIMHKMKKSSAPFFLLDE